VDVVVEWMGVADMFCYLEHVCLMAISDRHHFLLVEMKWIQVDGGGCYGMEALNADISSYLEISSDISK
jgi:hypothetical protein